MPSWDHALKDNVEIILSLYKEDKPKLLELIEKLKKEEPNASLDKDTVKAIYDYWDAITPKYMPFSNTPWEQHKVHHPFFENIYKQWSLYHSLKEPDVRKELRFLYNMKRISAPILSRQEFTDLLARLL